jgi:hypothetical protein
MHVGHRLFDAIVVPVIVNGERLASLCRRHGVAQASASDKLRHALDVLAGHPVSNILMKR